MMKKYYYDIDRLYRVWQRSKYCIEAGSKEEADKKIQQMYNEGLQYDEDEGFIENEILYDTERQVPVDENDGMATEEINDGNGNVIWRNGKSIFP